MRGRVLSLCVACGLLVSACGGEATRQLPSVVAVGLPDPPPSSTRVAGSVVAPSDRGAVPSGSSPQQPAPVTEASPTQVMPPEVGPDLAEVAEFVSGHRITDASTLEHAVVDVDGDGLSEVVFTTVVDDRAVVEIAWWDDGAFRVLASDLGGAGRSVSSLRVFDLTRDGHAEVMVRVVSGGRSSLSLWSVRGRGELQPLQAQGGCHDGSHVYGVVGARLVLPQDGSATEVVASCDDTPLPVRDWSEQRWVWRDGAFRLVADPRDGPPADDQADSPDDSQDDSQDDASPDDDESPDEDDEDDEVGGD